uniref:Uncharacterized protein n=1 Tax=Globodera rostochiensis TaxID=31243 RepID=A0A914H3Y7_GLORO
MVKFDWIRSDKPVVSQINLLGTPACRIGERPDKCSSTPVNNRADSMVRQTEEKKSPRKRKRVKLEQQEEEKEKPSHRNHKSRHANDLSSTSCSSSSSSDGEENDAQANNELLALTVNALTQLLAKADKKTKKKLLKATVQSLSPSSKEKQRRHNSKSHIKSERTHRRSSPHKRREHKRRKNGEKTEEANSPGPSSSLTSTPRLSSFPSIVPSSFSPMFTHSSSSSDGREKAKVLTTKTNSGNKVTRKTIVDNSHVASTDPSLIPLPNGSFVANSLDEFLRPPPPPPLSFVQALEQGQWMLEGLDWRAVRAKWKWKDRIMNQRRRLRIPGIVPTNTAEKNDLVSVEERMSVLVGFRAEEARKKRIEEELMRLLVDKKDDLFQRKVLMKLKENTRNDSNGGVSEENVQNKVNGSKDDYAVIGVQQTNPTTDEDSRETVMGEEVVEQTQHREELAEQTQHREELAEQTQHREELAEQTQHREELAEQTQHREKLAEQTQHREELAEQTQHREELAEQTQHREEVVEQTQHREELAEQTQHRDELVKQTQHRQPEPIKWSLCAVDGIVKPISRAQELENYRNKNRRTANSKKLKSTKLNFTQCEENDASRDVIESQQMDGTDCIDLDGKCFSFEQRQQTSFEENNDNRTISDAVDCPFDAEAFGAHSVMDGDEQLVSMLGLAYQLDETIVSDVMETFDSTLKGEGGYTNDQQRCEAGHAENDSNDVVNAFCSVENQAGIEHETGCVGQQNTFDSITEEHEDYTETRGNQQNMFDSVEAEVEDDTEIRDDTEMRVDQQNAFDLINSRPDEVCDEFCGDQSLRVPYSPLNANEYDDEIEEGEVVDDAEDNRIVSDNQQNWCEHGSTTFEASLDERKQQQKWEEQQVDKRIETGTMFPEERLVSREEEVGDNDFTLRVSVPAPMTPPRLASPTDEQRIPSPKTPPLQWTSYRSCIKMLQRREKRGKTNVLDVITLDEEYDL